MKVKQIEINRFKRFTKLVVKDLPSTTKLVVLVGPNGSGKTSFFEALNHWYKINGFNIHATGLLQNKSEIYLEKKDGTPLASNWYSNKVKMEFHDFPTVTEETVKGKLYFRTAYRNESDFTLSGIKPQKDPSKNIKLRTLMENDTTVSENYQRLIAQTLKGVYNSANNTKTVEQLREELIGKIRYSLSSIFEDLTFSSIGDPMSDGSFYFKKGVSNDFHYKNLSAGEKSVFDLLLDIIIKSSYFEEAIYCIDEPEAHMHTKLQSKVLKELYNLTPDSSQLWISTHSIGMLKQAEQIEADNPNTVVFLDFGNRDFDLDEVMIPAKIDKAIWDRFFDLAFADFSALIAPKKIVFCEGTSLGRKYKDFDAQIYSLIFESKHHDTRFISTGSASEIENIENSSVKIVANILKSSEIIKFVDRDDKSAEEIAESLAHGVRTSSRRHIESYMMDDEIITKLCHENGKPELIETCLEAKQTAINQSVERGNPHDDIKSASGSIFIELKRILSLTQCGNNVATFIRDTLTKYVTEDTEIYKELELEIFGNGTDANTE